MPCRPMSAPGSPNKRMTRLDLGRAPRGARGAQFVLDAVNGIGADEVGRYDLPLQFGDTCRQRRQIAGERLDGGTLRLDTNGGECEDEKQGSCAEVHKMSFQWEVSRGLII